MVVAVPVAVLVVLVLVVVMTAVVLVVLEVTVVAAALAMGPVEINKGVYGSLGLKMRYAAEHWCCTQRINQSYKLPMHGLNLPIDILLQKKAQWSTPSQNLRWHMQNN